MEVILLQIVTEKAPARELLGGRHNTTAIPNTVL